MKHRRYPQTSTAPFRYEVGRQGGLSKLRIVCPLGVLLLIACGGGPPPAVSDVASARAPASERMLVREGEWFSVNQEEETYLDGRRINHNAQERPYHAGRIVARIPPALALQEQSFVVVQAIISDRGHVARARLLKTTYPTAVKFEEIEEYLADALAPLEFTAARMHGEPVAVYYNLTVELRVDELRVDESP